MKYYLKENLRSKAESSKKNAIGKARVDVNRIFENAGFYPCMLDVDEATRAKANLFGKVLWHFHAIREIRKCFAPLRQGDAVYIQYPIIHHSIFIGACFHNLIHRHVQIVFLIHDLDTLRLVQTSRSPLEKLRITLEETQTLRMCTQIISHNDVMKTRLAEMGVNPGKILSLGLFDYLLSEGTEFDQSRFQKSGGIVIAGNLDKEKSAYLANLPADITWNLYGVGYKDSGRRNVVYNGSFSPEELVSHLEGSFGLVWDGISAETCAGAFGEYLRINNPHKLSLYLASGMPVIIWKEAALAPFVVENHVGLAVSSLYEIRDVVDRLPDSEYQTMKENAKQIGLRLRKGQYLLTALSKVEEKLAACSAQ